VDLRLVARDQPLEQELADEARGAGDEVIHGSCPWVGSCDSSRDG
jgi:hypothetical protein